MAENSKNNEGKYAPPPPPPPPPPHTHTHTHTYITTKRGEYPLKWRWVLMPPPPKNVPSTFEEKPTNFSETMSNTFHKAQFTVYSVEVSSG